MTIIKRLPPATASNLARMRRRSRKAIGATSFQAVLGNKNGAISVPDEPHLYYVRLPNGVNADGTTQYADAVPIMSGGGYSGSEDNGTEVYVGFGYDGQLHILGTDPEAIVAKGGNPRAENPNSPYSKFVDLGYAVIGYAVAVGTGNTASMEVLVYPLTYIDANGILQEFSGAQIDLTSDIPAADGDENQQVIAGVFINSSNTLVSFASTPKLASDTLTWGTDVAEVVAAASARAIAIRYFVLTTGQTTLTAANDFGDGRQWVTIPKRKNNFTATTAPTVNDDIDLNYEVGSWWFDVTNDRVFTCIDETDGAAVWRELSLDVIGAWNGTLKQNFDLFVTEAGGVITGSLDATNGGDLKVFFSDGNPTLDTDPTPLTVTLTAGTATVPQINHVYILQSDGLLTAKTSTYLEDWPTAEHAPVAIVILRTAAITKADGALGIQNINNRPENDNADNQGLIQIIGNHLRSDGPKWLTGVTPTITIITNGGSPDNVYLSNTSGLIRQFNPQTFPALDMQQYTIDAVSTGSSTFTISDDGDLSASFPDGRVISVHNSTGNDGGYTIASTVFSSPDFIITVVETIPDATADGTIGDDIHIQNRDGNNYVTVTDLNGELTDSTGASMTGKYFWGTFAGIINKTGTASHLMMMLPNGSYNTQANALADVDNTKNRSLPTDWDNTGFLLAETLFRHQNASGGTWTEIETNILLTITGGGGAGSIVDPITSFSDAVFDWFNSADPTKIVEVDLSALTAATTRTLAIQDVNGTIALVNAGTIDPRYVDVTGDTMSGTLNMDDNPITNVNYIDFDLVNGIAAAEGRMAWNDDEGTANLGLKGGVVNLQMGQEQVLRGKNATGGGTLNGRPARISGASGSNPEFDFSEADVPANAGSIGLFTEDVANNANCYTTTMGKVRGIDTTGTPVSETWAAADRIYVSNTTGQLTNVAPTGTERIIFIGIVLRAHATEGVIWVSVINVSYLSELSGVTISSPADNDVLAYDTASGLWINQVPTGGGGTVLLPFDARLTLTTGEAVPTADVTDSTVIWLTPYEGDRLAFYNGATWVIIELDADVGLLFTHTMNGDTHSGTAIIDNLVESTSQLVVGMEVTGTGVGVGAVIVTVDSDSQITVDVNSTATATVAITHKIPSDTMWDIFAFNNSGVAKLEMVQWTSLLARATAIAKVDGKDVKTGATTRLLVGSVLCLTAGAVSEKRTGNPAILGVSNRYNRIQRDFEILEATNSWVYATAVKRPWNNSTANRVRFANCIDDDDVMFKFVCAASGSAYISIGLSSTTTKHNAISTWVTTGTSTAIYNDRPGIGGHYLLPLEYALSSTTFFGDAGVPASFQAGCTGYIWG